MVLIKTQFKTTTEAKLPLSKSHQRIDLRARLSIISPLYPQSEVDHRMLAPRSLLGKETHQQRAA